MSEATGIQFVTDMSAWKPQGGIVVRIPAGIRSKQKLLAILADQLCFPAWSGRNWDALDDLLSDLSWLPPGTVTLVHEDLPFGPGGDNRGIYLSILRHANQSWADEPSRKLTAVFPAGLKDAVASALAAAKE